MALTDDQRAMLRLLAQREQGYEDIAALMGISVEEVRARVVEALEEVDRSGQTVAGEAEETEVVAAEPEAAPEPEPTAAATAKEPTAKKPLEPAKAEPTPVSKPPPSKLSNPAPRRPSFRLPKDQRFLAAGVGGIVVVALILVLAVSGGGSSPSSSTTTSTTTPSGSTNTSASHSKLTQAILSPLNGGSASGRALFGRIKKTVVLQVEANGLEPSPAGESYTVWLYRSPKLRIPLAATKVGKSGKLAAQYPLPSEVIAYLASGAFDQIDISLTKNTALAAALAVAKQRKSAPTYTGTDVLRGTITGPFVKK